MLNPDKDAANMALAQNFYSMALRGDVAGLAANCTPDVVWTSVGDRDSFPLLGDWHGREGVTAFFTTLGATLEFSEFTPQEFRIRGNHVFVNGRYSLTMRNTGRRVETDWLHVFTMRDGMCCAFREHTDTGKMAAAWRATSTESANLALVKDVYAAFGRGDVAAILAVCSPDIEWISGGSRDDFPTLGRRQGIEGAASFFRDVAEHDEFTSFEPRSFCASGDKVLVEGHYGITARATGKHLESDWLHVFTIAGGKGVRFQEFTDTAAFYKAGR